MRDGSETKERIERAALTLFVKRGIAETSIRQIARAARVSLGAMYNHYRSKDELAERYAFVNWPRDRTRARIASGRRGGARSSSRARCCRGSWRGVKAGCIVVLRGVGPLQI